MRSRGAWITTTPSILRPTPSILSITSVLAAWLSPTSSLFPRSAVISSINSMPRSTAVTDSFSFRFLSFKVSCVYLKFNLIPWTYCDALVIGVFDFPLDVNQVLIILFKFIIYECILVHVLLKILIGFGPSFRLFVLIVILFYVVLICFWWFDNLLKVTVCWTSWDVLRIPISCPCIQQTWFNNQCCIKL